MRRMMMLVLVLLPLVGAGCGGGDRRARLSAIETRTGRLEEQVSSRGSKAGAPGEEIVSEAPEYKDEPHAPYPPGGLPRYFNDTSEWETVAMTAEGHLVVPRTGMAAVVLDERAYVLGGHGPGLTQAIFRGDLEMIDSRGHVQRVRAGLLRRRYQTAEAYQGKIYIMAGMTTATGRWDWRKVFPDDLEIYDPATGSITRGAPIPVRRYLAASEILDSRIYLLGGTSPRTDSGGESDGTSHQYNANTLPDARLFIYDIATNRWTEGAPMEVARQCELVAHNGKLYAVAGFNGRRAIAAFEEYDPKTNRWTRLADCPFPLSAQRSVVVGDLLFSFGDFIEMTQICVYNFKTGKWSKLALRMEPARQGVAVLLANKIFVIGGNAGSGRAINEGGAGADPLATIQVFPVPTLSRSARQAER